MRSRLLIYKDGTSKLEHGRFDAVGAAYVDGKGTKFDTIHYDDLNRIAIYYCGTVAQGERD